MKIIYEDNNILIADKPRAIEVVSESGEEDFLAVARRETGADLRAVHRLDRNTAGLVVFAKNEGAENELAAAFSPAGETSSARKFYTAEVAGTLFKKEATLTAFLFKDSKKATVYIADRPRFGYKKIVTKYRVLKESGGTSLIEAELVTGRTHQIRAQFAHIGHPLIGDGKYGDNALNRKFRAKYQRLLSRKIQFSFPKESCLAYLNGRSFALERVYPE
jgi:23S rRNA pseudouridine955/2504/2580 synthase